MYGYNYGYSIVDESICPICASDKMICGEDKAELCRKCFNWLADNRPNALCSNISVLYEARAVCKAL